MCTKSSSVPFEEVTAAISKCGGGIPAIGVCDGVVEVAFGEDGVVEMPVHDWRSRESCLECDGTVEHRMNDKKAAITPTADA
jgi:hypothetical protein